MTKSDKIKGIIRQARSTIISVRFKKADGSLRTMSFNARYKDGIKGLDACESAQKAVETRKANNPDLINVIDLAAKRKTKKPAASWRSFQCETVVSIKSGGKVYEF
tara:strand:+ start:324 stop:641 length:318 start_codon:yes stop_codon:yes gene_type:complete